MAVAASILTAIHHMLKDGTLYQAFGSNHFQNRSKGQQTNRLIERLADLGYDVAASAETGTWVAINRATGLGASAAKSLANASGVDCQKAVADRADALGSRRHFATRRPRLRLGNKSRAPQ